MIRSVRQKNGEAGSALVEFALASIVILTVLFGIIDLGRCLYSYNWLSNSARLGSRYMMVRGINCNPLIDNYPNLSQWGGGTGCPASNADVTALIHSQADGIDWSKVTVTTTCTTNTAGRNTPPCGVQGNDPQAFVNVKVTYQFSFITPLVNQFVPGGSWLMSSSSQRPLP